MIDRNASGWHRASKMRQRANQAKKRKAVSRRRRRCCLFKDSFTLLMAVETRGGWGAV